MDSLIWVGIAICVSQSAFFSGMNLAVFSVSKLRLEVEALSGNTDAIKVNNLRKDSNFLLTTILWGNVAINVLLTLLSNSVMAGVTAFFFSTFIITFLGEIIPQAYFSRKALKVGSLLAPLLRFYQYALYPLAKPSAKLLDFFLGHETITYFQEKDFRNLIKKHIVSDEADIDKLEGVGVLNFLAIDDLSVEEEGEHVDPNSILELSFSNGHPEFPPFSMSKDDPFLVKIQQSGRKWVILTDTSGHPILVLDADKFLRSAFFEEEEINPYTFCHRPIIITDPKTPLGKAISELKVFPEHPEDDVVDHDIILVWTDKKRVITGSDLLGRLLRGISKKQMSSLKREVEFLESHVDKR